MLELTRAQEIILSIPAVLIAFSFHEFAHAWVATMFGDDTPRLQGRLTLDPRSHINWIGFILVVIGGFGWANPVQININKLRPRVLGHIAVSLAGIVMNFLLAILFGIAMLVAARLNHEFIFTAMLYIAHLNLWLAAFNLMPIPPLDGFHVIRYLLPEPLQRYVPAMYQYGPYLLLLLVLTGQFYVILQPIYSLFQSGWGAIMDLAFTLMR